MKFFLKRSAIEKSDTKELTKLLEQQENTEDIEVELPEPEDLEAEYSSKYSSEKLITKLQRYARIIGVEGVRNALLLYYALQSDAISTKHKAIILGSLGYLISFLDVIPDLTPVLGYSDDFALLAAAVTALYSALNDDIRDKAEEKLKRIFGDEES